MNPEQVKSQVQIIVDAAIRIDELNKNSQPSAVKLNLLEWAMGVTIGDLSKGLIDFENRTILETEMLEAASALPSHAAKAVLVLAVQSAAYIHLGSHRIQIGVAILVPTEDPERDEPIKRLKALALTLDPKTLLPKGSG